MEKILEVKNLSKKYQNKEGEKEEEEKEIQYF